MKRYRHAKIADFVELQSPRLIRSSYKNIAFPLGCARHELESAICDDDIVLLADNSEICALARLSGLLNGLCYVDFHVLSPDDALSATRAFLIAVRKQLKTRKFFIQLLPHETEEMDCLKAIGFKQEACMEQQIFINGRYNDLLVMGIRCENV